MDDVDELKHDLIERKARGKFIATVLKFGGPVLIWATVVIEAIRLKHGLK